MGKSNVVVKQMCFFLSREGSSGEGFKVFPGLTMEVGWTFGLRKIS